MLFIPLLPLGQEEKEDHLYIDEFEQQAGILSAKFDNTKWQAFASYLLKHTANERGYGDRSEDPLTWALVMRLLRNIVAHESSIRWTGVADCLKQVLCYTKTKDNFRQLIHIEEQCIVPWRQ